MARSFPENLARPRRDGLAWPRVGLARLGLPLLLALLTLLVLMLAYSLRPFVTIDMGGDFDSAFLRDFNGREIDAAGGLETFAWPAGQPTASVPGNREGVWIATIEAAPGQPDGVLEQAAVAINDYRADMPRRTARQIFVTIPPEIAAAETLEFDLVSPLVGGLEPPTGIAGEITMAPARTYRWSSDASQVLLPGLGRGAWGLSMTVVTAHPDDTPVEARVLANDRLLATIPDSNQTRRIHLLVPASAAPAGDLEITLLANTYEDPRPLGIFVADMNIAPVGGSPALRVALPPWGALAASLISVLGVYACLSLLVADAGARRWSWLPALGALAVIAAGGWALAFHRFPTGFMLLPLAGMAIWSLILLLLLRPFTIWLFRIAGTPVAAAGRAPSFVNLLLLVFFVSYWFKVGGMLYPYFIAIDVQWHMDRARWILDGQLPLLYGTSSPLNESTMPTAEWGEERPVIPYSPYYHMFAASLAILPFPLTFSANMVSVLLDSLRLIMIALIARKISLGERSALFAALMYAVMPVTFLLHAWGNVPTTGGLWLTLLVITFILVGWEHLHKRLPMVLLSVFILATFLLYTVTGVFMGVFLVGFTIIVWLAARQGPEWRALLPGLKPLWIATGTAMALALIIYYGQYIPPIIERSVPYFTQVFTQGAESVGVERPPFGEYMWHHVQALDYRIWPGRYLFYGLFLPLIFVIPGMVTLWKRPLAATIFAAWYSVAVLFMFVGYRISMVDKQLFFILPAIAICWAIYAERYWQRGRWARLMIILVYLFSAVAALDQWFFRIAVSPVA